MRLTILILVISVTAVLAQRRPQRPESQDTETASSQSPQRSVTGRGRARFVKTPDFEKVADDYEKVKEPKKRTEVLRRVSKPAHNIDRRYEVNENVDDIPDVRKYTKPSKVITENKFEAFNAPRTKLFEPVVTEPANTADLIKDFGSIEKGVEVKRDEPTKVELPQLLDTDIHSSTTEKETISSTEQESIDEAAKEIKKDSITPVTTPVTTKADNRKVPVRSRTRGSASTTEAATQRSRTRTRGTRKPEEYSAESSTSSSSARSQFRTGRRRTGHEQETLRGRGPSIIDNHDEQPGRARNERRVLTSRRKEQDTATSSTTSTENTRVARIESSRRSRTRRPENPPVAAHKDTERGSRRRSFVQVEEATTKKEETNARSQVSRGRIKSRYNPNEDSIKSESVAEEYKPRPQTRSRGRSRTIATEELVASSTVENPMRSLPDSSTARTAIVSRRIQAHPESANRIRSDIKQRVKETVMSEVSEVVSTRKITRRKKVESTTKPISTTTTEQATTTTKPPMTTVTRKPHVSVKIDEPRITVSQVITRGSKKSEVKLERNNKKPEEDDLDEANYPPQFKALILAKNKPNGKKGSRADLNSVTGKSTTVFVQERVVQSIGSSFAPTTPLSSTVSIIAPTVTATSTTHIPSTSTSPHLSSSTYIPSTGTPSLTLSLNVEDSENELVPKTTRLPRRRFSVSTKPPHKKEVITTRKAKPTLPPRKTVIRSTTFAPEVTSEQSTTAKLKFHARFSLTDTTKASIVEKVTINPLLKRSYPVKPSRIPYTRKPVKNLEERKVTRGGKGFESAAIPAQVVSLSSAKKPNRYSSRYRSESRPGTPLRSSTVVPAYVPTVPTVTPTNQVSSGVHMEDKDGYQIISIDDPVNSLFSDNLISENNTSQATVQQNETKPVSIIERIINSITSISTTVKPDGEGGVAPTGSSSILKIASKKPRLAESTTTVKASVTTEKPTTIIERILSSLSAIQASDHVGSSTHPSAPAKSSSLAPSNTPNPLGATSGSTIGDLLNLLHTKKAAKFLNITPKVSAYTVSPLDNEVLYTSPLPKVTQPNPAPLSTVAISLADYLASLGIGNNVKTTTIRSRKLSSANLVFADTTTTVTPSISGGTTTATNNELTNEMMTIMLNSTPLMNPTNADAKMITTTSATSPDQTTVRVVGRMGSDSGVTTNQAVPAAATTMSSVQGTLSTAAPDQRTTAPSVSIQTTTIGSFSDQTMSIAAPTVVSSQTTTTGTLSGQTMTTLAPAVAKAATTPTGTALTSDVPEMTTIITPSIMSTTTSAIKDEATTVIMPENPTSPMSMATDPSTMVTDMPSTIIPTTDQNTETMMPLSFEQSTIPMTDLITTQAPSSDSPTKITIDLTTIQDATTIATPITTEAFKVSLNSVTVISPNNNNNDDEDAAIVTISSRSQPIITTNQSNRSGKLLSGVIQDQISNDISQMTSTPRSRDYFVFGVLPNNTIVRKRPPMLNNAPYLIVGVYPNNTIVHKYPNGTIVPEEPVVQVSGFDTRDPLPTSPPPPPPVITNRVTEQGMDDARDTKNVVDIQANLLSLDNSDVTANATDAPTVTTTTTTVTNMNNTDNTTNLSTLTELLGGKIAEDFRNIVNQTVESGNANANDAGLVAQQRTKDGDKENEINNVVTTTVGATATAAPTTTTKMASVQVPTTTVKMTTANVPTTTIRMASAEVPTTTVRMTSAGMPTTEVKTTSADAPTTTIKTTMMTMEATTTPAPTIMTTTSAPMTTITTMAPFTTTDLTSFIASFLSTLRPVYTPTTVPTTVITTDIPTTLQETTSTTQTPTTTQSNTVQIGARGNFPAPTTDNFLETTYQPTVTITARPSIRYTTTPNSITSTTRAARRTTTFSPTTNMPVRRRTTTPPPTTTNPPTTTRASTTTTRPTTTPTSTTTTARMPTTTTLPPTTTSAPTTILTTTQQSRTTINPANVDIDELLKNSNRKLSETQLRELEAIRELEREQKALLEQLAFLTNLNIGQTTKAPPKSNNNGLANRILAFAAERNNNANTQKPQNPTTTEPGITIVQAIPSATVRQPKKVVLDGKGTTLDDILKELNSDNSNSITDPTLSTYGKSQDAIIAAILKERGIEPITPKSLGDQIRQNNLFDDQPITTPTTTTTTTRRPRTTTQRAPGRLVQGLNWLLNAIAPPPTTLKPRPRPKPTTQRPTTVPKPVTTTGTTFRTTFVSTDFNEIFGPTESQTTFQTTRSPRRPVNSLSEDELQNLIAQLEAIQRDPKQVQNLDLRPFKNLQRNTATRTLDKKNVEIISSGTSGSNRVVTRAPKLPDDEAPLVTNRGRQAKSTTLSPVSVSNSIDDDEVVTNPRFRMTTQRSTTRSRPTLPPVQLNPVPGVNENSPMIGGQFLNAAVNVTRAISTFLGSAIQGAAQSFQTMIGSGSRGVGNYFGSSSPRQG